MPCRSGSTANVLGIPDGPGPIDETGLLFTLDDSVLGTFYSDGVQANIEDVMTVADRRRRTCATCASNIVASGGGDEATIETTATTDACVFITDISAETVGLADLEGIWTVELERTAGSAVAEALEIGGPTGIRLSARMGPDGAISLAARQRSRAAELLRAKDQDGGHHVGRRGVGVAGTRHARHAERHGRHVPAVEVVARDGARSGSARSCRYRARQPSSLRSRPRSAGRLPAVPPGPRWSPSRASSCR